MNMTRRPLRPPCFVMVSAVPCSNKKRRNEIVIKPHMVVVLLALTAVVLGCNMSKLGIGGGGAYTSERDRFSVAFPDGPSGVETSEAKGGKYTGSGSAYAKSFDNRSDNYRSYEVDVFKI